MNRKLSTFAERVILFAWILFILLVVETVVFYIFAYESGKITSVSLILSLMISAAVFFAVYKIFNKLILRPYKKCRKLFQGFINGQIYQELFQEKEQVFPEMKPTLEYFDKLLDRQNAIQLSTKQAEFLALQNQINPHFLYNTLEGIRGEALDVGLENIADITEALSTFFRYMITETGTLVTLQDELESVKYYFTIQQYRFGEKLKMEIELPDEESEVLQLQFPKLTLQPIIENAIFHGLEEKEEGGTILIHIDTTPDKVLVSIQDDGVGIPENQLEQINKKLDLVSMSYISEERGIALNNVCRRIKLLFGEEYGIHIFSMVDVGTDVRIQIPCIKSQRDLRP